MSTRGIPVAATQAEVEILVAEVRRLRERISALETAGGLFASDKDLDSPRGDPTVKFMPRQYRGPDCKGRPFSKCPPAFLDELAETLTYMANHPKEGANPKYTDWNRADAAKCRAWARRIRSGKVPAPVDHADDFGPAVLDPSADFDGGPKFDADSFDHGDTFNEEEENF